MDTSEIYMIRRVCPGCKKVFTCTGLCKVIYRLRQKNYCWCYNCAVKSINRVYVANWRNQVFKEAYGEHLEWDISFCYNKRNYLVVRVI